MAEVHSTQALHTQNYSTTIFVNQSLYTSVTASGSITAGYSTFAELSVTIGIAATQGYTLQTGVSYTIPSYVPSGRYRITSKYPGSTVGLSIWNNEPSRIFNSNVTYAPDKDTAYRALERYANP